MKKILLSLIGLSFLIPSLTSAQFTVPQGGTGTTTAPVGQVLFGGPFSGLINRITSNSNLFWDNINKRLGIGTTTPTNKLSVSGTEPCIQLYDDENPLDSKICNTFGQWFLQVDGNQTLEADGANATIRANGAGSVALVSNAGLGLLSVDSSGNINIGTAGNPFQVGAGGNITKINGVTTSWPSSQGAATTILQNNGSGVLTWVAKPTGTVTSIATNNGLTGGTITTTGTIGLNTTGLTTNALVAWNGSNLVATGTPQLTIGYLTATSTNGTATSTFAHAVGIASSTPSAEFVVTNSTGLPSMLIEDQASPDTSPFEIDTVGNVGVGTSTSISGGSTLTNKVNIYGTGNLGIGFTNNRNLPWTMGITNPGSTGDFSISAGNTVAAASGALFYIQRSNGQVNLGSGSDPVEITSSQILAQSGPGDGTPQYSFNADNTVGLGRASSNNGELVFSGTVGGSFSSPSLVFRTPANGINITNFTSNRSTDPVIISIGQGGTSQWSLTSDASNVFTFTRPGEADIVTVGKNSGDSFTLANRKLIVTNNNTGLGTTTPATTLDVNGDITDESQKNCSSLATNNNGKISCASAVSGISTSTASYRNQTATLTSVNTLTPTASSTYAVSVSASVKTITAGTLTITATYTNVDGVSSTATFFPMGLTTAGLSGTGSPALSPLIITPMKNTAITVVSTFTGAAIAYDIDASILPVGTTTL